jgi:hypothetical protein
MTVLNTCFLIFWSQSGRHHDFVFVLPRSEQGASSPLGKTMHAKPYSGYYINYTVKPLLGGTSLHFETALRRETRVKLYVIAQIHGSMLDSSLKIRKSYWMTY